MYSFIKQFVVPILLLLVGQECWAEKVAQAVLMTDNTMYFVYDEPVTVNSTYLSKTVSEVWSGEDVVGTTEVASIPGWYSGQMGAAIQTNTTKVVFDASFASVLPKNCSYWFMGFINLTEIENLEYLNTSQVVSMYDMFANCIKLTTLNLSNFDTSQVTDMRSMFQNCKELTTIYVGSLWTTTRVDESIDMFKDCEKLKGGNNTTYLSSHTDKEYARIDGGTGSPGYLTDNAIVFLLDNADNTATLTAYNGQTKSVTLMGRTLYKDGSWNTLCLPFDLTISGSVLDGATIKLFDTSTSLSDDGTLTLKFKAADATITAGTPFIIKWASSSDHIVNPTFSSATISGSAQTVTSTDGKVNFVAKFSPFNITSENINDILYLGSSNKIGYSSGPRTLKSCRAHFLVPAVSNAKAVSKIDFDEETAAIIEVEEDTHIPQLSTWYTLDGRRLDSRPTTKGIYIHNGKKAVLQ